MEHQVNSRVEESGRPRESHKLEIVGSNPAFATSFIAAYFSGQKTSLISSESSVRIRAHASSYRRVEEFGRPRESHKLEIVGSNPTFATSYSGVEQSGSSSGS